MTLKCFIKKLPDLTGQNLIPLQFSPEKIIIKKQTNQDTANGKRAGEVEMKMVGLLWLSDNQNFAAP